MHSGRWEWLVWVSLPKDEGGCLAGPREGQAGAARGLSWSHGHAFCGLWDIQVKTQEGAVPGKGRLRERCESFAHSRHAL